MAALAEVFAERACRGPGGQVVDPLSVLPALFAILWRGRLAYLDNRVLDSGSTVCASRGGRADDPASGAASGDMLRLGGETHTMAGLESATVRPADVTGAVTEAAGLSPIAASSSSPQPRGEAARW